MHKTVLTEADLHVYRAPSTARWRQAPGSRARQTTSNPATLLYLGVLYATMTRMWCLDPSQMCQQHVLGEHFELHKLAGGIDAALDGDQTKHEQIRGQAQDGNIDVRLLVTRHELLEDYGGWDSPLPWTPSAVDADLSFAMGNIDVIANKQDLIDRCDDCATEMTSDK